MGMTLQDQQIMILPATANVLLLPQGPGPVPPLAMASPHLCTHALRPQLCGTYVQMLLRLAAQPLQHPGCKASAHQLLTMSPRGRPARSQLVRALHSLFSPQVRSFLASAKLVVLKSSSCDDTLF